MTETLKDQAIALRPLNRLLACRLMESTGVYQLPRATATGHRKKSSDWKKSSSACHRLSPIFLKLQNWIINPLILIGDKPCAVDACVIIRPSDIPSPLHLVISPYPNQYGMSTTTKGGLNLLIRPIKPADAPLLEGLFNTLSEQSVYYRFFSPMKTLSRKTQA